jgi:ATP-dependent RNA helicase DeaD
MDQRDREEALIKFRNGTDRILLGSDLAARGIDVPELDFIIHYELPYKEEEFTHRNGRTARMHSEGVSYLISEKGENLPLFIKGEERFEITTHPKPIETQWDTLFITGGRKDKISKGDIAGLFMKIGQLNADQIGYIELKHDCAYVAVNRAKAHKVAEQLNNSRLKKKKVRISVLDKSPF